MIAKLSALYRRIVPVSIRTGIRSSARFKNRQRSQRIKQALEPWGGANLRHTHHFFYESMFKQPAGSQEMFEIRFKNHPQNPILVRTGSVDPVVFRHIFLNQQYAPVRQLAPDAKSILDLGANIGYAAVWFALMYPEGHIYALEPLPENFSRLQRQVQTAGLADRIDILPAAISDIDGRESIYLYGDGRDHLGASLITDAQHREAAGEVNCLSLPSILNRFNLSSVDVIKLDAEGIEGRLFTNPPDSFRHCLLQSQVVVIEPHGRENFQIVDTFFSSAGWKSMSSSEVIAYYPVCGA